MKVFGVTGLPGSGKSIISRIAKSEDITIISMGNIIRDEARKHNTDVGRMAVKLRKQYGKNVVADRCIKQIYESTKHRTNKKTVVKTYKTHTSYNKTKKFKKIQQDIYMIEGIRSPQEVNYFRKHFKNFKVIAIHSSPKTRFNRLKRRKRSDDSPNFNNFLERDKRELKFGIGNVISTADFMLINEGPIPTFKNTVRKMIINDIKPKPTTRKRKSRQNSRNKNKSKQNRKYKKSKNSPNKHDNKRNKNKPRKK